MPIPDIPVPSCTVPRMEFTWNCFSPFLCYKAEIMTFFFIIIFPGPVHGRWHDSAKWVNYSIFGIQNLSHSTYLEKVFKAESNRGPSSSLIHVMTWVEKISMVRLMRSICAFLSSPWCKFIQAFIASYIKRVRSSSMLMGLSLKVAEMKEC